MTGFSCNNNCIFCSNNNRQHDRSTEQIIADVGRSVSRGATCEGVEFIGGEAAIRDDIFILLNEVKKKGIKNIRLTSNGRIFSYPEHVKKLVDAGLNQLHISLYGSSPKVHNAITRTRGSFKQTVAGIDNAKKEKKLKLTINTVICKYNLESLKDLAKFLIKKKIKYWNILDLLPDGRAKQLYKYLKFDYQEFGRALKDMKEEIKSFQEVCFVDFPYCVIPEEIRKMKNINYLNADERYKGMKQVGYKDISRMSKKNKQGKVLYKDKYRKHLKFCDDCSYIESCGGVSKAYLKDSEFVIKRYK
ncbi:radical SAM protein [Candidatus Margulisiibacteriota bacterium]